MIKLLVFDVDGCLTNGQISYSENGDEIKSFNVKDGLAMSSWIRMGNKAAIITGRRSKIVERRAKELGINFLHQGVHNKLEVLKEICKEEQLELCEVAAIGDDLNDYSMLKAVGQSFTPADGSEYIRSISDVVLYNKGGNGAVREMIEVIIKDGDLEEEFLKIWN
ncbi:HAD hydrolase family protein [Sulfurimonas sp. MAG313]|nr:HAD hydrolase family protein [Sulfurimonas sp. MAG313]MDF1880571.1 HAD hydrolase family protein [Sulfurimonas sp. MAG313]